MLQEKSSQDLATPSHLAGGGVHGLSMAPQLTMSQTALAGLPQPAPTVNMAPPAPVVIAGQANHLPPPHNHLGQQQQQMMVAAAPPTPLHRPFLFSVHRQVLGVCSSFCRARIPMLNQIPRK